MMTYESNGTAILDEIDRLFVVYDKAKEYLNTITSGIDQQIGLWQHRRQIILDQIKSSSSSSFDFLLPKAQRINELTIDAVQALCRVDLLVEQTLRIDPKSLVQSRSILSSASFSARSIDTNVSHSTSSRLHHPAPSPLLNSTKTPLFVEPLSNGKSTNQPSIPMPVLRTQHKLTSSNRSPLVTTQEKAGFKPIEQQQQQQLSSIILDSTSRPTPIHPQTNQYTANEGHSYSRGAVPSYETRTSPSDHMISPVASHNNKTTQMMSTYPRLPSGKVKVKLQRIPPGTRWKRAKIDVIDSLSAFYVENLDPKVNARFHSMLEDLHNYYDRLERAQSLIPLDNISIGDFGVAKYSDDRRWYRARLLMSEEADRIRIVFIDFGNIETKSIYEFFPLDKSYTELPAQAIACTLSEAYPRTPIENDTLWPQDTIAIFREEVTEKDVEVSFVSSEEENAQWPLHFVRITVNNQTVTNLLNLKQRIEPRPDHFIAGKLATQLTHQEYILFNVPIGDDDAE